MKPAFGHRLVSAVVILALVLTFAVPALAQEPDSPPACIPMAATLAQRIGVDCKVIMDLHAEGVGFGQVMMAWKLSEQLPGFEGTWRSLLDAHLAGEGWGERIMAYRLAGAIDEDPDEILELKRSGLGWGEIRQQFRLGPGKPPWAGGPPVRVGGRP
ncbi:MAG: hypothetical protein R6X16_06785 [Anaerolineae bacterium]